mgnify:CR=1 FL=1
MKKLLFFACILGATGLFAQSPIGKGGQQLNFGIGFSDGGLPSYVSYDFGVHQDITVSPQAQSK